MKNVPLSKPFKRGETEIAAVELREPSAGELRGLDMFDVIRMNVTAHRSLIPRISNLTANEFDQLSPRDLLNVQTEVVGFFTE
ncbi:TPA: phage tail assembly protein [Pseudomonas aeruginosa]|uniref:phage tail assembly protein n=1 Tax=Pseudomonas aeruginosa TaxID=287 RepID=UPI00053D007E|nr:phage tail assembly protein [Pseudomonas aeruginosa]EIU5460387.1 phage tail assembly protein [Pseudomonas aeruginosa]EIU5543770.1 phage tail assembly protein [Pseudomonas aeruginosa]EKW4494360.1 phage tail assembly protein [Pseudomonas aeruginosa]EKY0078193.1 phage tail assembly protein [Pseudomonas aeruginosa]EKY0500319.1 phage tail assembly protein [Pseudomonas aeruginosa]